MKPGSVFHRTTFVAALLMVPLASHAAIAPDRTRVIFNADVKSVTVTLKNNNATLPYLAQVWLEDDKYAKDSAHFTALPPLQRIEPKSDGQIKIQPMPGAASLPQDKESLFYFNVREIPPKSDKPNTLQLALQTRIKFFYRPDGVAKQLDKEHPFQTKLTLTYLGDSVVFDNPTPFYQVISNAGNKEGNTAPGFKNLLLAPREKLTVPVKSASLGNTPVVNYVDDFGGHRMLIFNCTGNTCHVNEEQTREAEKKANVK